MIMNKKSVVLTRTLGVALVAATGLGGCATYKDEFATINSRLDSLDTKVNSAAQSAESANQSAQQANQRTDQIESRVQRLETVRRSVSRAADRFVVRAVPKFVNPGTRWPLMATGFFALVCRSSKEFPYTMHMHPLSEPRVAHWR